MATVEQSKHPAAAPPPQMPDGDSVHLKLQGFLPEAFGAVVRVVVNFTVPAPTFQTFLLGLGDAVDARLSATARTVHAGPVGVDARAAAARLAEDRDALNREEAGAAAERRREAEAVRADDDAAADRHDAEADRKEVVAARLRRRIPEREARAAETAKALTLAVRDAQLRALRATLPDAERAEAEARRQLEAATNELMARFQRVHHLRETITALERQK